MDTHIIINHKRQNVAVVAAFFNFLQSHIAGCQPLLLLLKNVVIYFSKYQLVVLITQRF